MRFKKIMASALTTGMMLSFIPAATAMADTTGWKGEGEYWRYFISETEYYRNTWEEIDGHWYYFMDDGSIVINCWALIDGKAYHFDTKGHMEKERPLVELYFEPGVFSERCTEKLPLRVDCIHRLEFRGVRASGSYQEGTGKSGSYGMWNHPRGHVWNVFVRPASS